MPMDPVELELRIADIMFDRATLRNHSLSAIDRLARQTEDIVLSLLKLMAKDPTLSSPGAEKALEGLSDGLAAALFKWIDLDPDKTAID